MDDETKLALARTLHAWDTRNNNVISELKPEGLRGYLNFINVAEKAFPLINAFMDGLLPPVTKPKGQK